MPRHLRKYRFYDIPGNIRIYSNFMFSLFGNFFMSAPTMRNKKIELAYLMTPVASRMSLFSLFLQDFHSYITEWEGRGVGERRNEPIYTNTKYHKRIYPIIYFFHR